MQSQTPISSLFDDSEDDLLFPVCEFFVVTGAFGAASTVAFFSLSAKVGNTTFFASVPQVKQHTNKRTNEQTNKRTNEQTNKRTNEQTNKRTNKQTTKQPTDQPINAVSQVFSLLSESRRRTAMKRRWQRQRARARRVVVQGVGSQRRPNHSPLAVNGGVRWGGASCAHSR